MEGLKKKNRLKYCLSCFNMNAINDALLQTLSKEAVASSFTPGRQQTFLPQSGGWYRLLLGDSLAISSSTLQTVQPVRLLQGKCATPKGMLSAFWKLCAFRLLHGKYMGTSAFYSIRNECKLQKPGFLLIENTKCWGKPQLGNNQLTLRYSHTHRCVSHQNI